MGKFQVGYHFPDWIYLLNYLGSSFFNRISYSFLTGESVEVPVSLYICWKRAIKMVNCHHPMCIVITYWQHSCIFGRVVGEWPSWLVIIFSSRCWPIRWPTARAVSEISGHIHHPIAVNRDYHIHLLTSKDQEHHVVISKMSPRYSDFWLLRMA